MKKLITLTILCSTVFAAAHAQDILVKKNGKTIEGKVVEVGIDKVLYKINNDSNSANFVVRKSELSRIEFENGQTVWIDPRGERTKKPSAIEPDEQYGQNMINVSPFKALDSGPGFGISYERILDRRGYFGLLLPFTMTIPDTYYLSFDSSNGDRSEMYYFSPTLKIYPFGQRRVTYALGPTIFAGVGQRWNTYTDYNQATGVYITREEKRDRFRMGMIVNNYVNFQIMSRFQIGLNAGLGPRYIDRETFRSQTTRTKGFEITGEFNFNLGFRF
jgi:hypothetical protein